VNATKGIHSLLTLNRVLIDQANYQFGQFPNLADDSRFFQDQGKLNSDVSRIAKTTACVNPTGSNVDNFNRIHMN
jgi:hypothetical protein